MSMIINPFVFAAATVPDAPTGLIAVGLDGEVSLTWTAPANDGGSAITDYEIQWRTTTGPGTWNTFSDGAGTATTATVTGLTNGTSYDFQVRAVNSVGAGAYSAIDSAMPEGAPEPTFLGYRTLNGSGQYIEVSAGWLNGESTRGKTYAFYFRPKNLSSDSELFHGPSYNNIDLYWSAGANSMRWYNSSGGADLNPNLSMVTNNWYIFVFESDGSGNADIHRWTESTGTWSHTSGLGTIGNGTYTTGTLFFSHDPYFNMDIVAAAIWDRQLNTTEIETLDDSYAAWEELNPESLWRFDNTTIEDLGSAGNMDAIHADGTVTAEGSPLVESDV